MFDCASLTYRSVAFFSWTSYESPHPQEEVVIKNNIVIPYQLIFRILLPQGKIQEEFLSPYLKRK